MQDMRSGCSWIRFYTLVHIQMTSSTGEASSQKMNEWMKMNEVWHVYPPVWSISCLQVHEEAWNAYPYTRTRFYCPFIDKFTLDIETYFFQDSGCRVSWLGHSCFTMETKWLCNILQASKMTSFSLCWPCMSKLFLRAFLVKRLEAMDHWEQRRCFGTFLFHSFPQGLRTTYTALRILKLCLEQLWHGVYCVSINYNINKIILFQVFLAKQFKWCMHSLWCVSHLSQFLIRVLRTNLIVLSCVLRP